MVLLLASPWLNACTTFCMLGLNYTLTQLLQLTELRLGKTLIVVRTSLLVRGSELYWDQKLLSRDPYTK